MMVDCVALHGYYYGMLNGEESTGEWKRYINCIKKMKLNEYQCTDAALSRVITVD